MLFFVKLIIFYFETIHLGQHPIDNNQNENCHATSNRFHGPSALLPKYFMNDKISWCFFKNCSRLGFKSDLYLLFLHFGTMPVKLTDIYSWLLSLFSFLLDYRQQPSPLLYNIDIWPARNSRLTQRETKHWKFAGPIFRLARHSLNY